MFKKIILTLSFIIVAVSFQKANAKSIKLPDDRLKKPIELCQKSPDPELSNEALRVLQQTLKATQCGKYDLALKQAYDAIELLQELQQTQTQIGFCYYRLNCAGRIATQQKITKKQCKDIFGGQSWRQVHPAPAACVSPL